METMYLKYFIQDNEYPFFIHICEHSTDFKIHIHQDFYEMVIVLKGSAMHVVDDEQYMIQKGDVFVVGNKISHGYRDTKDFQICNIMFRKEQVYDWFQDIKKLAGFHALFILEPHLTSESRFCSRLSLTPIDSSVVNTILENLINEFNHAESGSIDMIQALFMQLVVFLSRRYNMDNGIMPNLLINIARSVSYTESHFNKKVSIEDLAEISNLSVRHFNRCFKVAYKTTPIHYLTMLRLECAKNLLMSTNKGITEIALQSGFQDINYFSRIYKRNVGMSPREYRLSNLKRYDR